jgi:hypothetical protein
VDALLILAAQLVLFLAAGLVAVTAQSKTIRLAGACLAVSILAFGLARAPCPSFNCEEPTPWWANLAGRVDVGALLGFLLLGAIALAARVQRLLRRAARPRQ